MALATGESGVCGVLGNRREPGAQQGREAPPLPGAPRAPRPERTDCYFPPRRSPAAEGAPDAAGTKPGPRPLPTCLFLRRSAPQPGGRDKSAAASRVRADRARATLKEPRGGSREARAAGVGKSLQPPKP